MATALERRTLSEQQGFLDRVNGVLVDVARGIQVETSPSLRRIDLSYQVLRFGDEGITKAFARTIAGFPAGSGGAEVTYNSSDTDIKAAVQQVWDYVAGVKVPTPTV